ncbi:hypothetical protein ABB37_07430 [Leptomonas pyrrhocoris]|uniref:Uncharacterized protein n=1 Tax=Leptomonas pyrrhocoris TaxID=157538 RepID=A0A0M9FVU5_LEPPY|nr:hypothetical protein ABB37_07430 [Leptomonas pyrrhocoris]KPA77115.1 hypothetical protein ABB37_07430 [Leptomonas pyrrhocoris]|eukprot:XP_015655554.1 hypothetical protein ABB37_07430 [Leptomonas pyrrhocoris]
MWTVIRKRQGLSPNKAPNRPDTDYGCHQRCIQLHEVRPDVPPSDPTAFSKAYGGFIYMKIRRWMLDEREHVRLQAVDHLIECYTEKREHCVASLPYNMLPILLLALERDESAAVRERAGLALEMLVRETQTQKLLLESPDLFEEQEGLPVKKAAALRNVSPILASLHDTNDDVVVTGLRVVLSCHAWQNSFAVTAALVQGGILPRLVELIQHTNTSVAMFACSATRQAFQVKEAHVQLLRLHVVSAVTSAIVATDAVPLIAEAAEVLSLIAEYPQGRRDALACRTLEALLPHFSNGNLTLRVALFSAAAQITVLEAAKMQATELGIPALLVHEIAREDERDVLMHMLRLLYNLAEWPTARAALRECLPRIAALKSVAEGDDVVMLALQQGETILNKKGAMPVKAA